MVRNYKFKKYKMKKELFFILGLVFIANLNLQAQKTINGAGGSATGTGGNACYSIGQIMYKTNGTGFTEAQGVQQAAEVMLGINETEISLNLSAYPNPTTNNFNLEFGDYDLTELSYQLFDLHGKELGKKTKAQQTNKVDVSQLNTGIYLLSISKNDKAVKIYKIIKN